MGAYVDKSNDINGLTIGYIYSEVSDATPTTLSSYERENNSTPCDVCNNTGATNERAQVYCTICDKKFCDNHQQVVVNILYYLTT